MMGSPAASPLSTPKRKHSQISNVNAPSLNTFRTSFDFPVSGLEDGSSSPRTKVAHKFRGLALEDNSGGGVVAGLGAGNGNSSDSDMRDGGDGEGDSRMTMGDQQAVRKRMRLPTVAYSLSLDPSDSLGARRSAGPVAPAPVPPHPDDAGVPADLKVQAAVDPGTVRTAACAGTDAAISRTFSTPAISSSSSTINLRKSYPSNKRLSESKSRRPKRTGTPPLIAPKVPSRTDNAESDSLDIDKAAALAAASGIVDPVRAALTWQKDEITGDNPTDEDDDGTGINGIGFAPTPAIAYARAMKRQQQLAEYRRREEREARARRSQRRHGRSPSSPSSSSGRRAGALELSAPSPLKGSTTATAVAVRKVRFLDVEPAAIITTT